MLLQLNDHPHPIRKSLFLHLPVVILVVEKVVAVEVEVDMEVASRQRDSLIKLLRG